MNILNVINRKAKTCDEELNLLDIAGNIFYSLDNNVSIYIKVNPISFDYLNSIEKDRIVKKLNMELAGERNILKIITMSLPISTKQVCKFLEDKKIKTNNSFKRICLLKQIEDINNLSMSGEMIEKQVIIQLFQKYEYDVEKSLINKANELVLKLQNAGLTSHILNKKEIIQLFNSFLNMKVSDESISERWSKDYE